MRSTLRSGVGRPVALCAAAVLALALVGCGPSVSKLEQSRDVDALARVAEKPGQDFTRVCNAADALGRIGDARAVELLSGWVSGDDDTLRTAGIPALGATGNPAAVEPLVAELAELEDEDPIANEMDLRALVTALGKIDDPRAAKALLKQVDAEVTYVIDEECLGNALAGQGDDILPELKRRLKGDNPDNYLPCGVALYRLREKDKTAVGKLLRSKATQRIWAGIFADDEWDGYEDDLTYALRKFGDVDLAKRMIDSGSGQLDEAAKSWAAKNGYMVLEIMQYGNSP